MANDLSDALAGFEKLIAAEVTVRVEAALAQERAEMQRRVDNAVSAALANVRNQIVQAVSLLEQCGVVA